MGVFLLVGIALASNLEARNRNHERGLEVIRGTLSTAVHAGRTGAAIVVAVSEKKAQADAEDRKRILQVEADAFTAYEVAHRPQQIQTLIETKQEIVAEGTKPIIASVQTAPAPQGSYESYIYQIFPQYGQDPVAGVRVMYCESGGSADPKHNNVCRGLFQFNPGTWAGTPWGNRDILDGYAQVEAAAWMWSQGRRGEWTCQ